MSSILKRAASSSGSLAAKASSEALKQTAAKSSGLWYRIVQNIVIGAAYNVHVLAVLAPLIAFIQLRARRVASYTLTAAFSDWGLWIATHFGSTVLTSIVLRTVSRKVKMGKILPVAIICGAWAAPWPLLHWFRVSKRPSFIPAVVLSILFYIYSLTYLGRPEETGRRSSEIARSGKNPVMAKFWEMYQEYFSLKVVNVSGQKLDPAKPRVMGYHPHGMAPGNAAALWQLPAFREEFPDMKVTPLTDYATHAVPAMRDMLQMWGVREASKTNFTNLLQANETLAVVPGGAAEIPFARAGDDLILVTKHKGFIREALAHGASLVPCLSLGEHEIFDQQGGGMIEKVQSASNTVFGFPFFLPKDRIGSPVTLIPNRQHLVVLVGPELTYVIKGSTPTREEIDKVHAEYFATIRKMFDENAAKYGYGHYKLIFEEDRVTGNGLPSSKL